MDTRTEGGNFITRYNAISLGHFCRKRDNRNGEGNTPCGLWVRARWHEFGLDRMTSRRAKQSANWPAKCKPRSAANNNAPNAHGLI